MGSYKLFIFNFDWSFRNPDGQDIMYQLSKYLCIIHVHISLSNDPTPSRIFMVTNWPNHLIFIYTKLTNPVHHRSRKYKIRDSCISQTLFSIVVRYSMFLIFQISPLIGIDHAVSVVLVWKVFCEKLNLT